MRSACADACRCVWLERGTERGADQEGGPVHQRVPAQRLWRCWRPRRVSEPGAGEADRGRGALLRRSAASRPPTSSCGATRHGRPPRRIPTRALAARSMPFTARSRWPRTRSMPTSSTATPGTPTWAGCWRASSGASPYVLSIHSLEPLRPWKVEQLGNGYHLSSWMERTALEQADAVIAVSARDPRRRGAPVRRRCRPRCT